MRTGAARWNVEAEAEEEEEASPVSHAQTGRHGEGGEEAWSAPFSLTVPKRLQQTAGVRFTCRSPAAHLRFASDLHLRVGPCSSRSSDPANSDHEAGDAELPGSEEPEPVRHQRQDEGHG